MQHFNRKKKGEQRYALDITLHSLTAYANEADYVSRLHRPALHKAVSPLLKNGSAYQHKLSLPLSCPHATCSCNGVTFPSKEMVLRRSNGHLLLPIVGMHDSPRRKANFIINWLTRLWDIHLIVNARKSRHNESFKSKWMTVSRRLVFLCPVNKPTEAYESNYAASFHPY